MSKTVNGFKPLRFVTVSNSDFESTLKKRVGIYFKDNNISKYANVNMKVKTAFMLCLYFVPYILVLTEVITSTFGIITCWVILGFGAAGIGMSVIHDANHGSYSKNKKVNYILGRFLNVIGGYAPTWKVQHNVLHHTYTNIKNYDEDITPSINVLRFTPQEKHHYMHRFQHLYAWFFYSLMTVLWITTKDWTQLFRYKRHGLNLNDKFNYLLVELIISKLLYYTVMIVLPLLILDIPWWSVFLLLLLKHMIAGFTLSVIFLLAHIVPDCVFPEPVNLEIKNNWAIHQLETTSNFGPKSKIFHWLIGGLNYQVEHHLFPDICHVHYKKLSTIVKQTAKEFNVPYYCEKTFFSALSAHISMLRKLGEQPV